MEKGLTKDGVGRLKDKTEINKMAEDYTNLVIKAADSIIPKIRATPRGSYSLGGTLS